MFGLTFANPLFVWMLPAALLPVLFHLFLRIRKRPRPFSSLLFFTQADPRLRARRKVREWLALLLRTLLLAFLLLALARPACLGGRGSGAAAMILAVDNSGSMSGPGPARRSKLAHALDGASALAAAMKDHDAAAVVLLVPDVAAALPDGLASDRDALRTALGRVKATEASGQPPVAMERALGLLEASPSLRPEIHVFSDLQSHEWSVAQPAGTSVPAGLSVIVHRIATAGAAGGNATLSALRAPALRVVAGRHAFGEAEVQNAGPAPVSVQVCSEDREGNRGRRALDVPAGASRTCAFPLDPGAPGPGWVSVWIEGDALDLDNRGALAFVALERQRVRFIGGPDGFGLLPAGVSPGPDGMLSGLVPTFGEAGQAGTNAPSLQVVVADGAGAAALQAGALRAYVESGGRVMVIAPAGTSQPGALPEWTGAAFGAPEANDRGQPALVFEKDAALWRELTDDGGDVLLTGVKVFRYRPLALREGAKGLLGLEDGRTLLCERRLGRGVVFTCGFAMDAAASNLPLKPAFLAFAQGLALVDPEGREDVQSITAGARPAMPFAGAREVHAASVAGNSFDWRGKPEDVPAIPRSGVVVVRAPDRREICVAVCSEPREGDGQFLRSASVPALAGLPHAVVEYSGAGEVVKSARRQRTGVDLFLPLLLLALACALAETWVVNPAPRLAAPAQAGPGWRRWLRGSV